jgi:hypothetical protein
MEGESSPQRGEGQRAVAVEEDWFRAQLQLNAGELLAATEGRNRRRRRNPRLLWEPTRARERTRGSGMAAGGEREEPAAGTEGSKGGTGARDFAGGGEEDSARWTVTARSGLGVGERNGAEPL